MNSPAKPECLNFTPLEERLKSLCIPFMQIILCEFPRGRQLSIHGNAVNVPADVNSVVNNSAKTYKRITNHCYKIEKQAKLEVPLSVSQC